VPSLSSGWQQQLSCRLAQEKWVLGESIRITAHAAIPVLSLVTTSPVDDDLTEHEDVAASAGAVEDDTPTESRTVLRVDITLEDPNHRGLCSKAMINWLLSEHPNARPVTLVLKQWLIERTYGTSHTGGLCSYGLLLMVVGFLQHCPTCSAAAALVGCLDFYGHRFDPKLYGVSVARKAFLHRQSPRTWPQVPADYIKRYCAGAQEFASLPLKLSLTGETAHRFDPLWIEDPLNPTNNVGRNCFRIRQIQRSLARAADELKAKGASSLRAILRVEGFTGASQSGRSSDCPEAGDSSPTRGPRRWGEAGLQEAANVKRALQEDLYRSLVEHPSNLTMPLPQIARSHLSQQWDSVVRYAARPHSHIH